MPTRLGIGALSPWETIFCWGTFVPWSSRTQKYVTLSIPEVEHVAMTEYAKETLYLRNVLAFLTSALGYRLPVYLVKTREPF